MSGSMRDEMPATAAWIDELRAALGAELVNKALRQAKAGKGVFYATETLADGTVRTYGRAPRAPVVEWPIPANILKGRKP